MCQIEERHLKNKQARWPAALKEQYSIQRTIKEKVEEENEFHLIHTPYLTINCNIKLTKKEQL